MNLSKCFILFAIVWMIITFWQPSTCYDEYLITNENISQAVRYVLISRLQMELGTLHQDGSNLKMKNKPKAVTLKNTVLACICFINNINIL